MQAPRRPLIAGIGGLGGLITLALWAVTLTPAAAAGEGLPGPAATASALFFRNSGAEGRPVEARIGPGQGVAVRGGPFNCAGCHGTDARGRSEGGVAAPAIDWHRLTKPWGHAFDDGRRRKPYDEASFHRAITAGVDASGNALDAAMPRFSISPEQAGALFQWLRHIDAAKTPGVTPEAVFIGYPDREPASRGSVMQALRNALQAANAQGGIHGRRVEWVAVRGEAAEVPVLALVCAAPLAAQALPILRAEIPTLGCERGEDSSGRPREQAGLAAYTLFPGTPARQALLAAYAEQVLRIQPDRIWVEGTPLPAQAPMAVIVSGLKRPDPALLALWNRAGPDRPSSGDSSRPWILLSEGEQLAGYAARIREQWPQNSAGILAGFPLPPPKRAMNTGSAAARLGGALAAVMLEALRQSGRELNPARLASSISQLQAVAAGDFPRIRFEPGGTAGLHGMHIAELLPDNQGWSARIDWFEP